MERKNVNKKSLNLRIVSLFIIIFILFYDIRSQNKDFERYIESGDKLQKQFYNKEALNEYENAYNIAPDNYEILLRMSRVNNDIGEDKNSGESEKYYEDAIKYAEKMRELYPDSAMTYFYLAGGYGNLALFKGGKEKVKFSQKVEKNIKKAIRLNPKFDQSYLVLGIYYREVANLNWILKLFAQTFFGELPPGTNEEAIEMLNTAIELKPEVISHHYELALTYLAMDEDREAEKHLKMVLNLPVSDHLDNRKITKARELLNDI